MVVSTVGYRVGFLGLLLVCLLGPAMADTKVDFAHDVVPILRKHCTQCHGAAKRRAVSR